MYTSKEISFKHDVTSYCMYLSGNKGTTKLRILKPSFTWAETIPVFQVIIGLFKSKLECFSRFSISQFYGVIFRNPSCKDGNARFTKFPLKALSDPSMNKISIFYNFENFKIINNLFSSKKKRQYLPNYWLNTCFKGTNVNRELPSLYEGSFEIRLTVS